MIPLRAERVEEDDVESSTDSWKRVLGENNRWSGTASPTATGSRTKRRSYNNDPLLTPGERIGATIGLIITTLIVLYFILLSIRVRKRSHPKEKRKRSRKGSRKSRRKRRANRENYEEEDCGSDEAIIEGVREDDRSTDTLSTQSSNDNDDEDNDQVSVHYHSMDSYDHLSVSTRESHFQSDSAMTSASAMSYYTENSPKFLDPTQFHAGSQYTDQHHDMTCALANVVTSNVWPRGVLHPIDEQDSRDGDSADAYIGHQDGATQYPFDEEQGVKVKKVGAKDRIRRQFFVSIDDSVLDMNGNKPSTIGDGSEASESIEYSKYKETDDSAFCSV